MNNSFERRIIKEIISIIVTVIIGICILVYFVNNSKLGENSYSDTDNLYAQENSSTASTISDVTDDVKSSASSKTNAQTITKESDKSKSYNQDNSKTQNNVANDTSMQQVIGNTKLDTSKQQVIDIAKIEPSVYSKESNTNTVASAPAAEVIHFSGNMASEDQEDYYNFTAPYDGIYRIDVSNLKNEYKIKILVYNDLQELVNSNIWCPNGDGLTLSEIQAGKVYTILVIYGNGYSDYALTVSMPKAVYDLTGLTECEDSLAYTNQCNIYKFKATSDGSYRFEITDMQNDASVYLYLYNELGELLDANITCHNEQGITKELSAGDYVIEVEHKAAFTPYKINIGYPKSIVDISEYTLVDDKMEYTDQVNLYKFIPRFDGCYRFELAEMQNKMAVQLYMYNSLGEFVASDTYCGENGEGITVYNLQAGEEYEIEITQLEEMGSYSLVIGKQKERVEVTADTIINDSMEFKDQQNKYLLSVKKEGTVTIKLSNMQSKMVVGLFVYDELGYEVKADEYVINGDEILIQNCSAGDYEIQIRECDNVGEYTMTVE